MHPRLSIVTLWTLTTLTAAQPQCDPLNQYEEGGRCCSMCGPGTYMTSLGTCLEPQCYPCEWNEYQESYTRESKCRLQPYCDTNVFFREPTHDRAKKTTCLCKEGYHCATKRCLVCEEHSRCKPGQGVQTEGTHDKDTVCEECPPGTYSDSAFPECKRWTECEPWETLHRGTNTSDSVCGQTPRRRLGLIAFVSVISITVVIIVVTTWLCRDKCAKKSCKKYPEDPPVLEEELKNTAAVHIYLLQDQPEDSLRRNPEENVHEPSPEWLESMSEVGLTEKGQCVVQENGKTELLSRQESQTQTFSG